MAHHLPMTQYRRCYIPGGTYFFTAVTHDRQPLFSTEEARTILQSAWTRIHAKYPFKQTAFCILPDHLHCIWTLPEGDSDYSIRWQGIKGLFSKEYNSINPKPAITPSLQNKREAGIWQRRFWEHALLSLENYNAHVDYIHFNPVKHGLVNHVKDWP